MLDLEIEKLSAGEDIPYELLLLADETTEAIDKYLFSSDIYIVKQKDSPGKLAAFVIQSINPYEIEIKNIAVSEEYQNMGIGSFMIKEIKAMARVSGFRKIWVGTPDSAVKEINFYKKNGFAITGLRENFFLENYTEPIIENGTRLKDMVMLSFELTT